MPARKREGKKLVVVPGHLVDQLTEYAKRSGLTLQELVTLVLSYAVRSLQGKDNIRALFTEVVVLSDLRKFGAMMVPQKTIAQLYPRLDEEARKTLVSDMKLLASAAVTTSRIRGLLDEGDSPKEILEILFPDTSIEDLHNGDGGKLVFTLRNSDPSFSEFLVEIAATVLEKMGYKVVNVETYGYIVVVEYRRFD